jgi:hypothetical protein
MLGDPAEECAWSFGDSNRGGCLQGVMCGVGAEILFGLSANRKQSSDSICSLVRLSTLCVGLSETDPPPGRHLIDPKLCRAYSQITSLRQASPGFVPSRLPDASGCGCMKGRNVLFAAIPGFPTHPFDNFRLLPDILGKPALRANPLLTANAAGRARKDRFDANTGDGAGSRRE